MPAENRTYVEDVDRTLYDVHDATDPARYLDAGLTPDIVREISAKKDEPAWMLDFRLKALDTYPVSYTHLRPASCPARDA